MTQNKYKSFMRYVYNAFKYIRNQFRIRKLKMKGVLIGSNCVIGSHFSISSPSSLSIGNNVYIGDYFYADCSGRLTISDGTIISNSCTIMTYNHDYKDSLILPYGVNNIEKAVTIGKNCWIGINVNICPGVRIGENSIIGMGSTVSKSLDANLIYGGNRVIKKRECTSQQYSLLEVRNVCHPIRYLYFYIIIKNMEKRFSGRGTLSFDELQTRYPKEDFYLMLYRYSADHSIELDFKQRVLRYTSTESK